MEEDDLVVLMYRLPTEAVDVESLRTPQVFHPKGHGAEALVGLTDSPFARGKNDTAPEVC